MAATQLHYPSPVRSIALRGETIAVGCENGVIYLSSLDTETQPQREFRGHTQAVLSVAWSSDGKRLMTGGDDGRLIVWDVESTRPVQQPYDFHAPVSKIICPSTGDRFLAVSGTVVWSVWRGQRDFSTRRSSVSWQFRHTALVLDAVLDPDGDCVASITEDGAFSVWDISDRKLLLSQALDVIPTRLAWNQQGLLVGTQDGALDVYNPYTGHLITTRQLSSLPIAAVAWAPTAPNATVAATWSELTVLGQTGQSQLLAAHDQTTDALAIDGLRLATGGTDQAVHLYPFPTKGV